MKLLSDVDKQKCNFLIHPKALDAVNFYQKISKKCSLDKLALPHIEQLFQNNRTYYARRIGKIDEIYIFSGFEFLQFSPHLIAFSNSNIILYSDITPEEIEDIAWASVFRSIFSSADYPTALSEIQLISAKLIADKKHFPFKFSDNELSDIFNLHRSSISKKKKVLKDNCANISINTDQDKVNISSFPPIFDKLK